MAFNIEQSDSEELKEEHNINVTPFIDVILVLLIIFMVAAPIATVSIPVNLPEVVTEQPENNEEPVYLTLNQELVLTLNDDMELNIGAIESQLQQQGINKQRSLMLRVDESIEYGEFVKLLNALTQAGYSKVGLVGIEGDEQ